MATKSPSVKAAIRVAAEEEERVNYLTPPPMAFLTKVLGRPKNERPFIMVPVGYPLAGGKLPDINRKPIDQALVLVDGS